MPDYSNLGNVVLANEQCFYCGKLEQIIIMQSVAGTDQISQFEGKTVQFIDGGCAECKEWMKQGVIVISTKDDDPEYRTGGWWVLKDDAIKDMFEKEFADEVLSTRCMFIRDSDHIKLGLKKGNA